MSTSLIHIISLIFLPHTCCLVSEVFEEKEKGGGVYGSLTTAQLSSIGEMLLMIKIPSSGYLMNVSVMFPWKCEAPFRIFLKQID